MLTFSHTLRWGRWALLLGLGGCIDDYVPEVLPSGAPLMVIDGFINGNGRTRISLSRSHNVAATNAPVQVRGAQVFIVDELGQRYPVRESALPGVPYTSDSLQLNPARRYRLRVQLGTAATAPVYESELVPLKVTPAFDQCELVHRGDEFQLQVSAHDANGQARYYRWRTIETWQFTSAFDSRLEVVPALPPARPGMVVRQRTLPIHSCYRTEAPSAIRQVSTAGLSQDVVSRQSILSFSDRAERVKIRYSVLVTQYAQTAEEYAYNELLRKNTEAVGTVNDPLPAQLTGNVYRVGNRSETVLGFVGAHTVVQRRLFATPASLGLPVTWPFASPYANCELGHEEMPHDGETPRLVDRPYTQIFADGSFVPTGYWLRGLDTLGYEGATRFCVDCRVRGNVTKPAFW